jgi:diguanylate cyclase (GGDEF)-like protein/PAS domain S-box-containing protein
VFDRSSALQHCSSREIARSSRSRVSAAAGHQGPRAAFDCRAVALRSQDCSARARACAILARLLDGLRRPAGASGPPPYDRRELCTELTIVATFAVTAAAMALRMPAAGLSPAAALVLGVLLVVILAVEFDVAEGRTSPVQLVLLPMLVVLPPAVVALVVAGAHVVRAVGGAVRGARPPLTVALAVGDAWYAIGPALVVGSLHSGAVTWSDAPVFAAAFAAQVAIDFALTVFRLRVGLRMSVRPELTAMGWVFLVDALLTPVGVLAAVAASRSLAAVTLVLPLAALFVVFARERRGRIENALALSRVAAVNEQRLEALVQNASDLILIAERDGTVRSLTGAAAEHFGSGWREVAGTTLFDHAHLADHSIVSALLDATARAPRGDTTEAEWRMRRPDGSWRHVEGIATNLLEEEHVEAVVVTVRDVHERRVFEEELRHRAFHDELTGLPNRALFYDRLEHALGRRSDRLVALVFADLDGFKEINDRLGHAAGDDLLVAFGARLRNCLRTADTPARLSGDEFGVLLEDVAGPNEPVQVAERIVAALAEPFLANGETVAVSASVGIVVSRLGDDAPDELLRRADLAMYAAKAGGKGRWELYDPELDAGAGDDAGTGGARIGWTTRSDEQREQVLSLLDRPDTVRTVFQPIIDLGTGEIAAYEALSRFDGPVDHPPNVWFEQAHRCGLGYRLEALAFERAVNTPDRPRRAYLTVNLSLSSLASEEVRAVLPERLDGVVIEITENELVTDKADVLAAMALVRERGARLAVDDAGSGYAGLQHVMRLEPDIIKLDRALVDGVAADPVKAALIEAFVRYGRRSDATICAEGIESLDDLEVLADIDVAYGQGWAVGRPAPPWTSVADAAAERCRAGARAALAAPAHGIAGNTLERAAEALAHVSSPEQIAEALAPVARDLRAARVVVHERAGDALVPVSAEDLAPIATPRLLADGAVAIVRGGAAVDPLAVAELEARSYGALLAVPVTRDGEIVAAVELYAERARPWRRFDVSRARMAAHHVAAALARIADQSVAVGGGPTSSTP